MRSDRSKNYLKLWYKIFLFVRISAGVKLHKTIAQHSSR